MLTIKECKKVFEKHDEKYTDKQIAGMLKLLTIFAGIDIKYIKKQ